MGKRLKIHYPGIQTLCTNCFGHHNKRNCQFRKVLWSEYITRFKLAHPNFPRGLYGRWGSQTMEDTVNWVQNQPLTSSLYNEPVASGSGINHPSGALSPEVTTDINNTNPIINIPMSTPTCNTTTENCNGPKRSEFQIPENESEHDLFIEKLMTVGSTRLEAEQIITSRKTKANREFKRLLVKQPRSHLRKDSKNSKRVSKEPNQHGAQACHT